MKYDSTMDFTELAYDHMYNVVDDPDFQTQGAEQIYKALKRHLRAIPFCNYLKQYIYFKADLSGKYDEIPIADYQRIIKDSFADNCTPASFLNVTSKISALSKNWLTQHTVKRNVVLLLGFGLNMSVDDVNEFLIKALRERGLNFKDPFEIICWYCYKNGYNYIKFAKLWESYKIAPAKTEDLNSILSEKTVELRKRADKLDNDNDLLEHVISLKNQTNESRISVTAREWFDSLYGSACEIVASIYNTAAGSCALDIEYDKDKSAHNARMYDYEKQKRIEQKVSEQYVFKPSDITAGDIERAICSGIPVDQNGNLCKLKKSKLYLHFHGKKFSRQHVSDILKGGAIDRFDLITLNFFIYSQNEKLQNPKSRYSNFLLSTNNILSDCCMGEIYAANPYECFILMCILSDDPLGTYADVWELGYEEDEYEDQWDIQL